MFHSDSAEESGNLRPYVIVSVLCGTSDVVEAYPRKNFMDIELFESLITLTTREDNIYNNIM